MPTAVYFSLIGPLSILLTTFYYSPTKVNFQLCMQVIIIRTYVIMECCDYPATHTTVQLELISTQNSYCYLCYFAFEAIAADSWYSSQGLFQSITQHKTVSFKGGQIQIWLWIVFFSTALVKLLYGAQNKSTYMPLAKWKKKITCIILIVKCDHCYVFINLLSQTDTLSINSTHMHVHVHVHM